MKVSKQFVALFIGLGLSLLGSCGGGGADTGAGGGGGAPNDSVASITVTPSTVTIDEGATATLSAIAKDSSGNVVGGATFTWESTDSAVASVANGIATGVLAGATTIRARAGSVASNAVTVTVTAPASTGARPACGPNSGNWVSLAAAVANVRVWYDSTRPTDQLQAEQAVSALDGTIWPTLITALGFKEPLADAALACNGGDGRLDIYIVPNLGQRSRTTPAAPTANTSEAYIEIQAGLAGDTLLYAVTHEFMDAIQWAYTMAAPQNSYGWMRNATANWAVEAVYPGNPVLLADATCHMNSNFLSITSLAAGACAGDTARSRDHGAYLLYQYIGRTEGNGKVRELLAATTTATTALDAVDAVVTGGLRALWPGYAKTLWNQAPVTDVPRPAFVNWDGQSAVPQLAPDHPTPVDADLGVAAEAATDLAASVDNVSTRFYRFTLASEATRSLMFHNTFYPVFKAGVKVSVQALWKTEDGTWVEEDWSSKEWIGLCRDAKAQRVAELVVIVASAETGTVTQAVAAEPPTFKRNNIGCWGYGGTAKRTDRQPGWSSGSIVANSTLRFNLQLNPGGTGIQYNDPATGRLRVPIAAPIFRSADWMLVEAYSNSGCSYALNASGTSTSIVLGGTGFASIVINNFAESLPANVRQQQVALVGTVRGAYTANAGSNLFGSHTGTVTGPQPDCGTSYESQPGMFLLTNSSAGSGPVIRLDGHLAGSFVEGDATFQWDLAPLREP